MLFEVVGVGNDTKMMKNAAVAAPKASRIDVLTSRLLGIILAILLLSAVVGIIFQTDYIRRFEVPRQGKGANAF